MNFRTINHTILLSLILAMSSVILISCIGRLGNAKEKENPTIAGVPLIAAASTVSQSGLPVRQSTTASVSSLVDAETGGVISLGTEVVLLIPPGSLAENTVIGIEKVEAVDSLGGDYRSSGPAYKFTPEGLEFSGENPAILTVSYDADASGKKNLEAASTSMFYLDTETGEYVSSLSMVNAGNSRVTAVMEHFSYWVPGAIAQQAVVTGPMQYTWQSVWPTKARLNAPLYVRASIRDFVYGRAVAGAQLYYRKLLGGPNTYQLLGNMKKDYRPNFPDTWGFVVPANKFSAADLRTGSDYEFCIVVTDNLNNRTSCPATGKTTPTTRKVDFADRVYAGAPITITPSDSVQVTSDFSVTFNATTTDTAGVAFQFVPDVVSLAGTSGTLTNYGQLGHSFSAKTAGTDTLTMGITGPYPQTATSTINIHPGNLERIEIYDGRYTTQSNLVPLKLCETIDEFFCIDPLSQRFRIQQGQSFPLDIVGFDKHDNRIAVAPQFTIGGPVGTINAEGIWNSTGGNGIGSILASIGVVAPVTLAVIVAPPEPSVPTTNVRDRGRIESGFLTGTIRTDLDIQSVEVSLDGASFQPVEGLNPWKIKLPTGANTWRDDSLHYAVMRAKDSGGNYTSLDAISIRKGQNRDINGDGFTDIVVSGHAYSTNTGRVYIFHSSGSQGFANQSASSASAIISGEATKTFFSFSLALGDINGDGYADLAASALNSSRTFIFYSQGAAGISSMNASQAATILQGSPNGQFGVRLAIADVNGDGRGDLIAGAPSENTQTGNIYAFYSRGASGIPSGSASSVADRVIAGPQQSEYFGYPFTMGDLNGDGCSDLIVSLLPTFTANRIFIFNGSLTGLNGSSYADANLTIAADQRVNELATGDLQNDGYTDLIAQIGGQSGTTGRVHIFNSSSGGITALSTGAANRIITAAGTADTFGSAFHVTDLNGDGFPDLAVGMPGTTVVGRVYIFNSSLTGINATTPSGANHVLMMDGTATRQGFGARISAGMMNADGFPDLILGASGYADGNGRAYVISSAGRQGITANTSAEAVTTIDGETRSNLGLSLPTH